MKRGPKTGQSRASTRLGALLCKIALLSRGKALALPLDRLAADLGYNREYLVKVTRRLRQSPWFIQKRHCVIFITHDKDAECPRGRWILRLVYRHALGSIHAAPGSWRRLRWHCRKGGVSDWHQYTAWLHQLFRAILFKKRRHGEYKGFSHRISGGAASARPPPADKKAAWRRFGKLASLLAGKYSALPGAPTIKINGWMQNQLAQQHSSARILDCLAHAVKVWKRRTIIQIDNSAAWICGVAAYHLEADGLIPEQRKRQWMQEKARGFAATQDEERQCLPETSNFAPESTESELKRAQKERLRMMFKIDSDDELEKVWNRRYGYR